MRTNLRSYFHCMRFLTMRESAPPPPADEAWVDKGPTLKRPDIKARGKMGIKEHRTARLHVVLREGPTAEEQQLKAAEKKRKHMLRAALMHGQFDAQVNRPVYNRGLTRGVGFV